MSKWVLISVEDNSILEPTTYDTYEQAYEEMERDFNMTKYGDEWASIHENYASIQTDFYSWDWRIYEVKF